MVDLGHVKDSLSELLTVDHIVTTLGGMTGVAAVLFHLIKDPKGAAKELAIKEINDARPILKQAVVEKGPEGVDAALDAIIAKVQAL